MGLFKQENPNPYFYIYANRKYYNIIETYLKQHFQVVIPLNLSSTTGCGFKIMSYDFAELKNLDSFLEQYEGWLQTSRRNEFNEFEANVLDLDNYSAGCNARLTVTDIDYIKFALNHYKSLIVFRYLNFLGGANVGYYILKFGDLELKNTIPANATLTDSKIYRKTLDVSTDIDITLSDCTLEGTLIEYASNGSEEVNNWVYEVGGIPQANTEFKDKDMTTSLDLVHVWAAFAQMTFRCSSAKKLKSIKISMEVTGDLNTSYKIEIINTLIPFNYTVDLALPVGIKTEYTIPIGVSLTYLLLKVTQNEAKTVNPVIKIYELSFLAE